MQKQENAIKELKKWIKSCPKCSKIVEYKNKYTYIKSVNNKKICSYCSRQKTGLENQGKIRTKETKNKISNSLKGTIFGNERNNKISSKLKGRNVWDWRKREIIFNKCLHCLKEFQTTPHRRENNHFCNIKCKNSFYMLCKGWIPRFNPKACQLIEDYGKEHGYNFQHALNGGEYHIKELGYWVDGYDKEKNVVIEYQEKHHNQIQNKQKDIIRKEKIISLLKCKFIEIYE